MYGYESLKGQSTERFVGGSTGPKMSTGTRTKYLMQQANNWACFVVSFFSLTLSCALLTWLLAPGFYWGQQQFTAVPCTVKEIGISYRGCPPEFNADGSLDAPDWADDVPVKEYSQCTMGGGTTQNEGSTWERGKCTLQGNKEWTMITGRTYEPLWGLPPKIKRFRGRRLQLIRRRLNISGYTRVVGKWLAWARVSGFPDDPNMVRCAYKYGPEAASTIGLGAATRLLKRMPAVGSQTTCHVMQTTLKKSCIVALTEISVSIMMREAFHDSDSFLIYMCPTLAVISLLIMSWKCVTLCKEFTGKYSGSGHFVRYDVTLDGDSPKEIVQDFIAERRKTRGMGCPQEVLQYLDDEIEYVVMADRGITNLEIFLVTNYNGRGKLAVSKLLESISMDALAETNSIVPAGPNIFHYSQFSWSIFKSIYLKSTFTVEYGLIRRLHIHAKWFPHNDSE